MKKRKSWNVGCSASWGARQCCVPWREPRLCPLPLTSGTVGQGLGRRPARPQEPWWLETTSPLKTIGPVGPACPGGNQHLRRGREENTLSLLDRDLNIELLRPRPSGSTRNKRISQLCHRDLPIIGSIVYCESSTLDHATTKVGASHFMESAPDQSFALLLRLYRSRSSRRSIFPLAVLGIASMNSTPPWSLF
uniref:Uncharacterized protein n=1 Tax=Timema douglasi TaxID=61478 RepID=A0A7R8ZEG0_TIMDO|nr:unnamed protein product [Timema douglasi]